MQRDAEAIAEDRRQLAKEDGAPVLTFRWASKPCPVPECGPFPKGVCTQCGLREKPCDLYTRARRFLEIASSGLQLERDDLTYVEWQALRIVRQREGV